VSTRKLILAALACGVAILVAGMVLLLSVPDQDDLPPTLPGAVSTTVATTR